MFFAALPLIYYTEHKMGEAWEQGYLIPAIPVGILNS